GTVEEKVSRLIERLEARGALSAKREPLAMAASYKTTSEPESGREVLVVAELLDNKLRPVSFEWLGKGIELAEKLDARLSALVAGSKVGDHVAALAAHGANRVYIADDNRLERYTTRADTTLLVELYNFFTPG